MISPEYAPLVQKLLAKSEAGRVNWKQTPQKTEFIVYFDDFSLSIRSGWNNDDNEEFVSVTLRNDEGEEIDRFYVSDNDPDWSTARTLYDAARRRALRIDEALKTMLRQLDRDDTIGDEPKNPEDIPF